MSMPDDKPITLSHIGQWSSFAKTAALLLIGLIGQTLYLGWTAREWANRMTTVEAGVVDIRSEQAAGVQRADNRQAELQAAIDDVVQVNRERATGLDARIRPLETQAAATAATLQSIQSSLQSIASDLRDLRRDMQETRK